MFGILKFWKSGLGGGLTAVQLEWLEFVSHRLQEDIRLPRGLATCKSTDDVQRTVSDFYQKALKDYHEEVSELLRLGTSGAGKRGDAMSRSIGSLERDAQSRSAAS